MLAGTAARFRGDRTANAFARTHRAGDAWCTVLCDSYEVSFSSGWGAAGGQLGNDAFERAWNEGGSPRERFDRAIARTLTEFRAAAPGLWTDDEWIEGSASASLVAVLYDGDLHVAWLGDHAAFLVRGGAIAAATDPHTLAPELARHGIDPVGHPQAGIMLRMISTDAMHEPDRVDWECRRDDHVIVASGEVVRALHRPELAALIAATLEDSAERIVDAVVARANPFGVIATVIRI